MVSSASASTRLGTVVVFANCYSDPALLHAIEELNQRSRPEAVRLARSSAWDRVWRSGFR
jgi:hypothetical protein